MSVLQTDVRMTNLWSENHPRDFWLPRTHFPEEVWQEAIKRATPVLLLEQAPSNIDEILSLTLGEGRFGKKHWELGLTKKLYYLLKPLIPKSVSRRLRQLLNRESQQPGRWLIEPRYVEFLWEIMHQVLVLSGLSKTTIRSIWPDHQHYAFILTHDIETDEGQAFAEDVADLEESIGFHSSFNFVPNRYKVNTGLMDRLRKRGFEIGVHGYQHNGKLFNTQISFSHNVCKINSCIKEWDVAGFRSELTLRQPLWMQQLDILYDLSFFDIDPYEPIPGGAMSIWPFFIGHFVELPYTLWQDNTLVSILGQKTPQLWLTKIDYIEKYHGLALINTHPDYLKRKVNWDVYVNFLNTMRNRTNYWHTLPGDAARWWKTRSKASPDDQLNPEDLSEVFIDNGTIQVKP